MKAVAFSLGDGPATKSSAKRVHEEDDVAKSEQISEFTVEAATAPAKKERKIISCKPNRVPSKMQAEPEAIGKLEDKFEASAQAQTVGRGVYGLMSRGGDEEAEHTREVTDLERLKKQTDNLPDEPDGHAYADMPVEDFGLALLRGMGMTKEHVVETVAYVARPSRMGLGAKPGEIVTGRKQNYKQLVGIDGSVKSVVRKGEKVIDVASLGPRKGKRMTVAHGRHAGLECEVKAVDVNGDSDAVRVRLFPSERDVTVSARDLAEAGAPAQPASRPARGPAHPSGSSHRQHSDRRNGDGSAAAAGEARDRHPSSSEAGAHDRHASRGEVGGGRDNDPSSRQRVAWGRGDGRGDSSGGYGSRKAERDEPSRHRRRKSWLREGIRVRIVSKHVGRGKAYLAKAVLTAVVAVGECHVMLDDGSIIEGVREEDLETVVSKKAGTRVMVVTGEHAGEHGKVLEKSKEAVMVQLAESREVVELHLDSVADYQGSSYDDDW
eukprot:jgi/Ulvmu1/10754/UM068_0044.1